MLEMATMDKDDLYWEVDPLSQSPNCKWAHIDEESLDVSVLLVKTAVSQKILNWH